MSHPIIGLTTSGIDERDIGNAHYSKFYIIPAQYVAAVRRAGGIPVLLPPGETAIDDWLELVDGVIIIGGIDVHPERYGGNSEHPALTNLDATRDETELKLVELILEKGEHPTLCICRGMQVLNVATGGTLHEHVADTLPNDIHREGDGWAFQPLTAADGSLVAEAMGAKQVTTASGHHQAVKDVGAGIKVSATAPDGVVEAIEHESHPWMVGVQWHPEVSAESDPTQQHLFDSLVEAARKRKMQHK